MSAEKMLSETVVCFDGSSIVCRTASPECSGMLRCGSGVNVLK